MPNITGTLGYFRGDSSNYSTSSGAFEGEQTSTGSYNGSSNTKGIRMSYNASNGETKTDGTLKPSSEHKTYGSSDYVTPKNTTIKLWKRIN